MKNTTILTRLLAATLAGLCAGCATDSQGRAGAPRSVAQMSALMGSELQGMRLELQSLRESVDGLSARLDAMGAPPAPAPPAREPVPEVSAETPVEDGVPRTITFGPSEKSDAPVEVPPLEIVSEYGRDLEAAAAVQRASLKGMVCVVPPDTPRAALERLGRDLRAQYDAYDNISIDVFDDAEAANIYAKQPSANAAHRVLKITRYRDTGQDVVVLYRDGQAVSVL